MQAFQITGQVFSQVVVASEVSVRACARTESSDRRGGRSAPIAMFPPQDRMPTVSHGPPPTGQRLNGYAVA